MAGRTHASGPARLRFALLSLARTLRTSGRLAGPEPGQPTYGPLQSRLLGK